MYVVSRKRLYDNFCCQIGEFVTSPDNYELFIYVCFRDTMPEDHDYVICENADDVFQYLKAVAIPEYGDGFCLNCGRVATRAGHYKFCSKKCEKGYKNGRLN